MSKNNQESVEDMTTKLRKFKGGSGDVTTPTKT